MNILAIIQARLSSTRLPGKVLRPLAGKPMLAYLLESLDRCRGLDGLVVATSTADSDNDLARFCQDRQVACHRGPLEDVRFRMAQVLDRYHPDGFVRICGDSPLLDHRLVEKAINLFRSGDFDLVTNVSPRTFPHGQSVEVIKTRTYLDSCPSMAPGPDREHVTPYFYREAQRFAIHHFESGQEGPWPSLAVDNEADVHRLEKLLSRLDRPPWAFSFEELVQKLTEDDR